MNLCRVLPNGLDAKAAVDEAINRCAAIGNLRADIHACKEAAEGGVPGLEEEGEDEFSLGLRWACASPPQDPVPLALDSKLAAGVARTPPTLVVRLPDAQHATLPDPTATSVLAAMP